MRLGALMQDLGYGVIRQFFGLSAIRADQELAVMIVGGMIMAGMRAGDEGV